MGGDRRLSEKAHMRLVSNPTEGIQHRYIANYNGYNPKYGVPSASWVVELHN